MPTCLPGVLGALPRRLLPRRTVSGRPALLGVDDSEGARRLGEVPPITDTAASTLYCVSLAIVLICLELMLISHHGGLKEAWGHMFKKRDGEWKLSKSMVREEKSINFATAFGECLAFFLPFGPSLFQGIFELCKNCVDRIYCNHVYLGD